jgi:hypothetical protein
MHLDSVRTYVGGCRSGYVNLDFRLPILDYSILDSGALWALPILDWVPAPASSQSKI